MNNFNDANFKTWKKSLKPKEQASYLAYQDNNKNRVVVYDNADALVNDVTTNAASLKGNGTWTDNGGGGLSKITHEESNEWRYGTKFPTYKATAEALATGSTAEAYMNQVEKAKDQLFAKFPELCELNEVAVAKKRRRRFSEDGDELDIDRYMACDPACFSSMPRQDVRKKVCRVYMDLGVSAGTSADEVTKNMVGMMAICDIIERAGISIEIIVGASSIGANSDSKSISCSCAVKEANEPLDAARLLSFALPGMYRAFIFLAWSNVTEGRADSGLGCVLSSLEHPVIDFYNADIKVQASNSFMGENNIRLMVGKIKSLFNIDKTVGAAY